MYTFLINRFATCNYCGGPCNGPGESCPNCD